MKKFGTVHFIEEENYSKRQKKKKKRKGKKEIRDSLLIKCNSQKVIATKMEKRRIHTHYKNITALNSSRSTIGANRVFPIPVENSVHPH